MILPLSTPALIFPAISLTMLAYTNRYIALSSLIRKLHQQYTQDNDNKMVLRQISNLRKRLRLVRRMQAFGIISFLLSMMCMFFIYIEWEFSANFFFANSLIAFTISLLLSLWEIQISTLALRIALSDMDKQEE